MLRGNLGGKEGFLLLLTMYPLAFLVFICIESEGLVVTMAVVGEVGLGWRGGRIEKVGVFA